MSGNRKRDPAPAATWPPPPPAEIRRLRGEEELALALELRRAVFCGEQGVSEAEEFDGRDGEALHLVALVGDELVGTCRLLPDGAILRLGRLAVTRAHRRTGLATALLRLAEEEARAAGLRAIRLHAQTAAERLYERNGYARRGERFMEAGIEHITMEKAVA